MTIKHISISHTIDIRNHETAKRFVESDDSIYRLEIEDVVNRIIKLNTDMSIFWQNPKGWAPIDASKLLSKIVWYIIAIVISSGLTAIIMVLSKGQAPIP